MSDPTFEATLTWSHQEPNGDVPYLGDAGEGTIQLTKEELWSLLAHGQRDDEGNVVTTVTLWPAIPRTEGT